MRIIWLIIMLFMVVSSCRKKEVNLTTLKTSEGYQRPKEAANNNEKIQGTKVTDLIELFENVNDTVFIKTKIDRLGYKPLMGASGIGRTYIPKSQNPQERSIFYIQIVNLEELSSVSFRTRNKKAYEQLVAEIGNINSKSEKKDYTIEVIKSKNSYDPSEIYIKHRRKHK